MANNNTQFEFDDDIDFKFDTLAGLEAYYIGVIRGWLWDAKENIVYASPYRNKHILERMLNDFFIEPKFEFYKAQALYITFTGVLKQPFLDWKIADEHFFTKLSKYYKKLYVKSKLQQIEGDFTNG